METPSLLAVCTTETLRAYRRRARLLLTAALDGHERLEVVCSVADTLYPTSRPPAAHGLLEDDRECIDCPIETFEPVGGTQLRALS